MLLGIKFKYILFFLLIVILYCSCQRNNNTPIDAPSVKLKGKVFDALTGNPISGVHLILNQANLNSQQVFQYGTMVTDISGNFQFQVQWNPGSYSYYIDINPSGNYWGGRFTITTADTSSIIFNLASIANLRVHLKNTSPYNANDDITFPNLKNSQNQPINLSFNGAKVDTTINWPFVLTGGATDSISYQVIKNSITTNSFFKVYLPACVTTTYSLNY